MNIIAVDIGNTNIDVGLFLGGEEKRPAREGAPLLAPPCFLRRRVGEGALGERTL